MSNPVENKLRTYLDRVGQSLKDFASAVGISQNFASEIASGAKYPSLPIAHRIHAETGGLVPMTYWLSDTSPYTARHGSDESHMAIPRGPRKNLGEPA